MTNTENLQAAAESEFYDFWWRSICADKLCQWWLNRIMGRA